MDGLPTILVDNTASGRDWSWSQRTLKGAIGCTGVGVHSGRKIDLTFKPAPIDHGIVFRRTDLGVDIQAKFDNVVDTRLCTVIANGQAKVGTVEHAVAALVGAGIDNAVVEVDGPEVPILDGSSAPFLFLLECAGIEEQFAPRAAIEVLRPVRVEDGKAYAELLPFPRGSRLDPPVLDMELTIDFAAPAIGQQGVALRLSHETFRDELARARTFAMAQEVEQLRKMGLALGGTLDNAVVVDGDRILNPAGLRMPREFARHKMLDAVGDLGLAGAPLHGRYVAHRTGHALNNKLLHALFADAANWRRIENRLPVAVAA